MYFFKPILKKDKRIATITSSIGCALGKPKFHKITPINQMMYIFIIQTIS
jgi:hypothetical protein